MNGGVGGSGQSSEGVGRGDAWMQRGRRKCEQMWRSDWEQRASGWKWLGEQTGERTQWVDVEGQEEG